MEIPLPEGNDIYSLGFEKDLSRAINGIDSNVVYNSIEDQIPAQVITLGGLMAGAANTLVAIDPAKGLWLGSSAFETAPFRVSMAGELNAISGKFTGDITGATGTFTGTVTVGSINIPDTTSANSFHVAGGGTYGGDTFWGANVAGGTAAAQAYVLNTGQAKFYAINAVGGTITGVPINSIPNNTSTDISLLEKTHDITFSVTDADTIAWTSGTITLSNGRTFSISSGNTGNMSALTYIYVDPGVSSTVLQTTTTASTAMGANKVLLGTAVNNTITASFVPYGPGKPLIDGQNIGAASVLASNIAANTITGNNILTMAISGKSATFDTGTIGGFTMSSSQLTATNFSVTSGAANTARLEVGSGVNTGGINSANGSSDITFWSGATFANRATAPFRVDAAGNLTATSATLSGYVVNAKGVFGGDGSDGALSISSGTTTVNLSSASVVVKNYTSISITGTGKLAFSNPNSSGTVIILKSQGNVTVTSSSPSAIDARAMGAVGGAGGTISGNGIVAGTSGNFGQTGFTFWTTNRGLGTDSAGNPGTGGLLLSAALTYSTDTNNKYATRFPWSLVGAGAGGGGCRWVIGSAAGTATGGKGGNGGGALIIECAGAFNFTTGTITCAGEDGVNGDIGTATRATAAGGAGGGGGFLLILYKTLTANTGTVSVAGGVPGIGVHNQSGGAFGGVGAPGGGGSVTPGTDGTSGAPPVSGTGGNGTSLIAQNDLLA